MHRHKFPAEIPSSLSLKTKDVHKYFLSCIVLYVFKKAATKSGKQRTSVLNVYIIHFWNDLYTVSYSFLRFTVIGQRDGL